MRRDQRFKPLPFERKTYGKRAADRLPRETDRIRPRRHGEPLPHLAAREDEQQDAPSLVTLAVGLDDLLPIIKRRNQRPWLGMGEGLLEPVRRLDETVPLVRPLKTPNKQAGTTICRIDPCGRSADRVRPRSDLR